MYNGDLITGDIILNTGFKESDVIQGKMYKFNYEHGNKPIQEGGWNYEKLAKHISKKLGTDYIETYKMGIDKLIELFEL